MIVSEKPHQNLSDYIRFFLDLNLIKMGIISDEKMRKSGNYNYLFISIETHEQYKLINTKELHT